MFELTREAIIQFIYETLRTERLLLDRYPQLSGEFGRNVFNTLMILTNPGLFLADLLYQADILIEPEPMALSDKRSWVLQAGTEYTITITPRVKGTFLTNLFSAAISYDGSNINPNVSIHISTEKTIYNSQQNLFLTYNYVFPDDIEITYTPITSGVLTIHYFYAIYGSIL